MPRWSWRSATISSARGTTRFGPGTRLRGHSLLPALCGARTNPRAAEPPAGPGDPDGALRQAVARVSFPRPKSWRSCDAPPADGGAASAIGLCGPPSTTPGPGSPSSPGCPWPTWRWTAAPASASTAKAAKSDASPCGGKPPLRCVDGCHDSLTPDRPCSRARRADGCPVRRCYCLVGLAVQGAAADCPTHCEESCFSARRPARDRHVQASSRRRHHPHRRPGSGTRAPRRRTLAVEADIHHEGTTPSRPCSRRTSSGRATSRPTDC